MSADADGKQVAGAAPSASSGNDEPSTSSGKATSSPPAKRHRGRNVTLVILAVLVVVVAGALWWALSPTDAKAYESPIDEGVAERNTLAFAALASMPIGDPLVAMENARGLVVYDVARSPANATWVALETGATGATQEGMAPDDVQRAILGALAEAVTGVERFEVTQMDGDERVTTWSVSAADLKAFFAGDLTVEAFEGRITKS